MHAQLSDNEAWSLAALVFAAVGTLCNSLMLDVKPLISCIAFSILGFALTYCLIRWLGQTFMNAKLRGKDMCKTEIKELPEAMGGISAAVYLFLMVMFMPLIFLPDFLSSENGTRAVSLLEGKSHVHSFPVEQLAAYQSALLSLALVVILGNYDDFFDIRWRHKVLIPAVAAIPILAVYYLTYGVTHIVVPYPIERYLGDVVNLGWLYYAYMAAVAIFCPNCINILAGINGIEVAQSIVIACLILCNDVLAILWRPQNAQTNTIADNHLFSIYLLLPFLGVSTALLRYNWFPAQVFVGDTYCYFAGMIFAILGILGHFSKTLLLLFLPQIFNFIYSIPQLLRVVPCPRHRLPALHKESGLLVPSMTIWQEPPSQLVSLGLLFLASFPIIPLLKIETDTKGTITQSSNLTIINLWLVWRGPKQEARLATELLIFQLGLGLAGLAARHELALLIFKQDNRI